MQKKLMAHQTPPKQTHERDSYPPLNSPPEQEMLSSITKSTMNNENSNSTYQSFRDPHIDGDDMPNDVTKTNTSNKLMRICTKHCANAIKTKLIRKKDTCNMENMMEMFISHPNFTNKKNDKNEKKKHHHHHKKYQLINQTCSDTEYETSKCESTRRNSDFSSDVEGKDKLHSPKKLKRMQKTMFLNGANAKGYEKLTNTSGKPPKVVRIAKPESVNESDVPKLTVTDCDNDLHVNLTDDIDQIDKLTKEINKINELCLNKMCEQDIELLNKPMKITIKRMNSFTNNRLKLVNRANSITLNPIVGDDGNFSLLRRSNSDGNLMLRRFDEQSIASDGYISHGTAAALPIPTPIKLSKCLRKLNVVGSSWKNLLFLGGMSRPPKAAPLAKKVAPPAVPHEFRHSGSSYGSAGYASSEDAVFLPAPETPGISRDDHSDYGSTVSGVSSGKSPGPLTGNVGNANVYGSNNAGPTVGQQSVFTFPSPGQVLAHKAAVYYHHQLNLQEDQGIDMTQSPGRDSPGSSSGSAGSGSRHSTASLDSGRASSYHPLSSIGAASGASLRGASTAGSSGSPRCSLSSCSIGSEGRIERLIAQGVPDQDIIHAWLTELHMEEYYPLFVNAGYDLPTMYRMTPEDLTAIGIKKHNHRKRLKAEIAQLSMPDNLPEYIPDTLEEWLRLLRLDEYIAALHQQGYRSVEDVTQLTWEDLEDIGIVKLGHQKKIILAIKRVKDIRAGKRIHTIVPSSASAAAISATQAAIMQQQHQYQVLDHMRQMQYEQDVHHSLNMHHHNVLVTAPLIHPVPPQIANELKQEAKAAVGGGGGDDTDGGNVMNRLAALSLQGGAATGKNVLPPLPPQVHSQFHAFHQPWEVMQTQQMVNSCYPVFQHQYYTQQQHPASAYCAAPTDLVPIKIRGVRGKSLESLEDPTERRSNTHHTFSPENTQTFYYQHHVNLNKLGWRPRSYDDGDITPTNEVSSMMFYEGGGGTLPRPRGVIRARPVAKISASKTPLFDTASMMSSESQCSVDGGVIYPINYDTVEYHKGNIYGVGAMQYNNTLQYPFKKTMPPSPPKRQSSASESSSCCGSADTPNGTNDITTVVEVHHHHSSPLPLPAYPSSDSLTLDSGSATDLSLPPPPAPGTPPLSCSTPNASGSAGHASTSGDLSQSSSSSPSQSSLAHRLLPSKSWGSSGEEQELIAALALQHRNGSDASFKSNSSTESESMPFANENAGTIKTRANSATNTMLQTKPMLNKQHSMPYASTNHPLAQSASSSGQSQPNSQAQSASASGAQSISRPRSQPADVLNDIGNMLANLTDELDAMLEEEKRQGLSDV